MGFQIINGPWTAGLMNCFKKFGNCSSHLNKIFVLKNSIKWSYNIVIGFATSSPTRSLDPLARLLHSLACSTKLDCGHPALTNAWLYNSTVCLVGGYNNISGLDCYHRTLRSLLSLRYRHTLYIVSLEPSGHSGTATPNAYPENNSVKIILLTKRQLFYDHPLPSPACLQAIILKELVGSLWDVPKA